ncbi:DUF6970 domain-containing protein [Spirosoma aureum]|uniref:DUF6970 domain-containing protein n=1 Tax=Spirosoma aureum TaxID=2692134 RepID=UPI0037434A78
MPKGIPACIEKLIIQTKSQPPWTPRAKIYCYSYKGKTVYYLSSRCCDIPSTLFDKSGNVLCLPQGGFTGSGDGKCTDFFTSRSNERLIWEDTRK